MSDTLESAARAHGIAIFEHRLITDAQPPISGALMAGIQSRCAGRIPDGLRALWMTCFGGKLDYDLSVDFDGQIETFPFTELFYPDSGRYRDLWGWIDHEAELAEIAASEARTTWSGKLSYLPFAGYEYAYRLHLCVEPGPDYGAVFAWTQGLPPAFKFRLHHDALARVADDVGSLFHLLELEHDPFSAAVRDYSSGINMAAKVTALRSDHPMLAAELESLVREAVLDWRGALERGEIAAAPRLRRAALEHAAAEGDTVLMARLLEQGSDVNERLCGGAGLLDHAIARGHSDAVRWLIARGADVSNAVFNGADRAPPELIEDLLRRGARVSPLAAVAAVRGDRMENARLIATALAASYPFALKAVIDKLDKWADDAEATAERVEAKAVLSNMTPQYYRGEARRMRAFRDHCQALLTPPHQSAGR